MKKWKKVLAVTVTLAMGAGGLAGCAKSGNDSSGGEEKMEEVTFPLEEPIQMSMFAIMNGENALPDNPAFQKAEELTNVKWEVTSVLGADLTEKKNLTLASGEYPDVFYKAGLSDMELEKYGKQGIFIPLNDLIKTYAPNLTKYLDEKDAWANVMSSDGNIYAIPNIGDRDMVIPSLFINKKWMDRLGLEEPTSLEELYEVLKAFKEQDANGNGDPDDEIPLTCTDVVTPELLLPYFGLTYNQATKCAEVDGKLEYIPTSETFKEYLAYVTRLYEEGLMDKNAFTQKHEQQAAIGQSGDVLGAFFDSGAFLAVGRERDEDYIILTPFEKGVYPMNPGINIGAMAITDKCEHPEVAVAWADQFYTEEGARLAWMGVEGISYEMKEDGSWEWLTGNGYGDDVGTVRSAATLQGAAQHPSSLPSVWVTGMTDPDEKYLLSERARVTEDGSPYPVLSIDEEDSSELSAIKADVDPYVLEYTAKVATGALELEDSWEEYLNTMSAMGVDRMKEIYEKAYEAGKELKKEE